MHRLVRRIGDLFRIGRRQSAEEYSQLYQQLRTVAFDVTQGGKPERAFALEMTDAHAATLLLVTNEGDLSMYRSDAPPRIGGGAHEEIRKASLALADFAKAFTGSFQETKGLCPIPEVGHACFYLLAAQTAARIATADLAALEKGQHPLSALWFNSSGLIASALEKWTVA